MKYVEVIANKTSKETVIKLAEHVNAKDVRFGLVGEDGLQPMRLLINDSKLQHVLDTLQNLLGAQPSSKIIVLGVEAVLPREENGGSDKNKNGKSITDSNTPIRESLYEEVEKNARLDLNYIILVILSTVVAAIGLIENNIAVLIGAMVIAPLLGPNLALSLGAALGDIDLLRQAAKTLFVGTAVAIGFAVLLGLFWPASLESTELLARTNAGLGDVALALASGGAAALSLSSGVSSVLVGVMVAVALLPPAATMGIMLGQGNVQLALGALLLLLVNITCINLASKVVFFLKGVSPRTWAERKQAKRSTNVYIAGWLLLLIVLVGLIVLREYVVIH